MFACSLRSRVGGSKVKGSIRGTKSIVRAVTAVREEACQGKGLCMPYIGKIIAGGGKGITQHGGG